MDVTAIQKLALAVLVRAAEDGDWNFEQGMFQFWCDLAGVEPGWVQSMVEKAG